MKKLKKVLLLITILFVVSITVFTVKTDGRYIFRAGLYVAGELGLFATDYFVKDFKENQNDFERIANLITDYVNTYDSDDESDSRFIYFTPRALFFVRQHSFYSKKRFFFNKFRSTFFGRRNRSVQKNNKMF